MLTGTTTSEVNSAVSIEEFDVRVSEVLKTEVKYGSLSSIDGTDIDGSIILSGKVCDAHNINLFNFVDKVHQIKFSNLKIKANFDFGSFGFCFSLEIGMSHFDVAH